MTDERIQHLKELAHKHGLLPSEYKEIFTALENKNKELIEAKNITFCQWIKSKFNVKKNNDGTTSTKV